MQLPTSNDPESGARQGGGGPSDMNGDHLTRIEGRLGTIEAEQRAHLRWMLLIAIGLASLFATGFGFMIARIDRTEDKISRVEDRISGVEDRISRVEDRISGVEDRISRVETSVAELPGKISQNLMQLNQTLLQAITATNNQRPPQIIIVPQGQTTPPQNPAPEK
jgi:septal ring factor EnvC (AmiA/AmiB activator)